MNKTSFACIALALFATLNASAATPPASAPEPQTGLARATLGQGIHAFNVQIADTERSREIGLMHRAAMPQREGMLFVFESAGKQCFWMKNTLIPLTAAFVSDDGTIVNLEDMSPLTLESHCSNGPVRYVIEMNLGWFGKNGLSAGSKITGGPFSR